MGESMSADDAFAAMFAEWFVILPGAEAAVEWNAARYTLGFWRMQQARGVWVNAQAGDVARWLDGLVREAVEGRFDADAYRADLDDARAARLRTLMTEYVYTLGRGKSLRALTKRSPGPTKR
jgi:hypothetical protein